jgi:exosortase/archaeosortase family protein
MHGDMVVAKVIGYQYNHGVWIGEPCNGIKVFGLFTIFILSFRGDIIKKLIFIPFGILIIHFLNILRIALLTYISAINPYILDFNHNVTFQLLIYGSMLGLWYIWIINFSHQKTHEN